MSALRGRVQRLEGKPSPSRHDRPLRDLTDEELDLVEQLVIHIEAHGLDAEADRMLASPAVQTALGKIPE